MMGVDYDKIQFDKEEEELQMHASIRSDGRRRATTTRSQVLQGHHQRSENK